MFCYSVFISMNDFKEALITDASPWQQVVVPQSSVIRSSSY